MNRNNFPLIAVGLSLPLLAALIFGGQSADSPADLSGDGTGGTLLPLLTLLAIAEFGLLLNLAALWVGARRLLGGERGARLIKAGAANLVCAVAFGVQLMRFWPL
ncbi:hypothetical protein F2Q65_00395 [Thiohalocapsa marina]|uniref:Uncharacterized protein n=1 Tax=Thiohalocapsa marina TaxID=424902 RepID=A0A5M8FVK6_9GAMM|nr:hypothetical protein [Thiohalocapsa marina]KAA6187739.1 hypothetical protein F2Q65_00395 [Thiohalocapsa marina]